MRGRRDEAGESSSDEEEDDPRWKAAIQSIASSTTFVTAINGFSNAAKTKSQNVVPSFRETKAEGDEDYRIKPRKLKHYEIKGQKLLHDMLDETLEMVKKPIHHQDEEPANGGGVRLFEHSPVGIIFNHVDEIQGPRKKPKLLPGRGITENSKELRKQLKSVAVDGSDILAAAREAHQKLLSQREAKDAAAKEKAKTEEERIAELKRIRGERWLPSIAREMKLNKTCR